MNKISVFITCYNVERFVKYAIESVLSQSYKDFQLVVLDDGSTDRTLKILEYYSSIDKRVNVYKNKKNMGLSYSRNCMFDYCDSEYIAILDADDMMPMDRLELEVKYLDENPDVIAVGGAMQFIDEDGEFSNNVKFAPKTRGRNMARLIVDNPFYNGTMMIRTSVLNGHNIKYDDRFNLIEDYKFWSDLIIFGKIVNINHIFLYYRRRSDSSTANCFKQRGRTSELYDIIHLNYISHICKDVLSEKEKKIYLEETKKIVFGERTSSFLIRIYKAFQLQKVFLKICNNCQYADEEFKAELNDMINIYTSQTLYKVMCKLGIMRLN